MKRVAIILALLSAEAPALAQDLTLGTRVGTTGPALELASRVSSRVEVRLGGAWRKANERRTEEPISFSGDVTSGLVWMLADLKLVSGLNASAGFTSALRRGTLVAEATDALEIAGSRLSPSELGQATFSARFPERPSPVVGLRFKHPVSRAFGLTVDAQVAYLGRPSAHAESSGRLAPTAAWVHHLENSLADLRWRPLLTIGVEATLYGQE
ncbi:MAG: hypothetical protein JJ896_03975 [Rhodothermales bacterium]|nr:hypothetical protein [Rhodothermales bacterium]MBO6778794.1 hypothetical protein [Rhodothermales bacterium]